MITASVLEGLTVVPNIFLIILASFSDSLGWLKIGWSSHLLFSAVHEGHFHLFGISLNRLLLLPMSSGFCLTGT